MPIIAYTKNKGNDSNVKGSILTKLIEYREFMVLIICTKNESNLTIGAEIWFRTDKKCGRTDGRTDRRMDDAKTISLRLRQGMTTMTQFISA